MSARVKKPAKIVLPIGPALDPEALAKVLRETMPPYISPIDALTHEWAGAQRDQWELTTTRMAEALFGSERSWVRDQFFAACGWDA